MSKTIIITSSAFPDPLKNIPNPPERLYIEGSSFSSLMERPRVAIVGSRKVTPYGRAVTQMLAKDLAKQGIVIVSGLALGTDAIAHKAALEAGGSTIAILPGGLGKIYPSSHHALAKDIIRQGGALLSEYSEGTAPFKHHFVARNRIVSGISDALLVTQAAGKSGTMHTAEFARAQGRPIFAVPGDITNEAYSGTNILIQQGAQLIIRADDITRALSLNIPLETRPLALGDTAEEQAVITLLQSGVCDGGELLAKSALTVPDFTTALTMLEIRGIIKNNEQNQWSLS